MSDGRQSSGARGEGVVAAEPAQVLLLALAVVATLAMMVGLSPSPWPPGCSPWEPRCQGSAIPG